MLTAFARGELLASPDVSHTLVAALVRAPRVGHGRATLFQFPADSELATEAADALRKRVWARQRGDGRELSVRQRRLWAAAERLEEPWSG